MTSISSLDLIATVPLTDGTAKPIIDLVAASLQANPPSLEGSGLGYVMAAGGRYARHGYTTCRFIREILQDETPIEVWVGQDEKVEDWGIPHCLHRQSKVQGGWPLKADAVKHSGFRHIVFLDSDCLPLIPAPKLTQDPDYLKTGALFFPDVANHRKSDWGYPALNLLLGSVPEMEAGQFLIDRCRHSAGVVLTNYFNQHPEFFYKHFHGDKDLWALAFARLGIPFTVSRPCENHIWGLRHFMPSGRMLPDSLNAFDHLIHTKNGKVYDGEHAAAVLHYLEEYEALALPR